MIFADIINTFPDKLTFLNAVNGLALEMNIPSDDLLICFNSESGINPGRWATDGKAVGLIQFRESTANGLNTTLNALALMNATEQMQYVSKFFRLYKNKWPLLKTATDVELIIFYPASVGQSCNYVITNAGSPSYDANSNIDISNDGVLTVADFSGWFYNRYGQYENETIKFRKCPIGNNSNIINSVTRNSDSSYATNLQLGTGEGVEYETILIGNKDFTSLDDVVKSLNIKMTSQELLNYKDNAKTIFNSYTKEDKAAISNGGKGYKTAVVDHFVPPVLLKIPIGKRDKEFMFKKTNFQQPYNQSFYLDKYALDLLKNPDYIQISEAQIYNLSRVVKQQNNIQVYIWCKALGNSQSGEWIDVTLFVQEVNFSTGKTGGNFTLKLASINCEYNTENGWFIPSDSIKEYLDISGNKTYVNRSGTHTLNSSGLLSSEDINTVEPLSREKTYFHNILQSNDIVLIKFKSLKLENDLENTLDVLNLILDERKIPGQIYDCIGLIDENTLVSNPSKTEVLVQITGRDLTKLIIEDGSYFFPITFCTDQKLNYFQNASDDNQGVQRVQGTGNALPNDLFNAYLNNSIGDIIQFVLSQEGKIQVCPDWVFSAYPANQKTTFIFKDESGKNKITNAPGIWQICTISIDEKLNDRLIADQTIGSQQGSLINHIMSICQEPFVEFFTDTWGDRFFFIARVPPWDEKGYTDGADLAINNPAFQISDNDLINENLTFHDNEVATWYRLTPRANYFGNTQNMALTYLQAVMLKEYAEIWGTRAMDVVTNYITYDSNNKNEDQNRYDTDYFKKQTQADLEFLIEVNAYLPFTRSGTITIKLNRAIKKGTFVWLTGTDEIGYVDYINHNFSINMSSVNSTTTLHLSRIMKRKYLTYYFNIVNLDKNKSDKINLQELQSNDFQTSAQFIFNPDSKYLITDKMGEVDNEKLFNYFQTIYSIDYDTLLFQQNLTDFDTRNFRAIESLAKIFSVKQNIEMTLSMALSEFDDPGNSNIETLLRSRGEVIKNKIIKEVRESYGKDVSDSISIGKSSIKNTDGSFNFITGVLIESFGTAITAKDSSNFFKQFNVNREIFNFFLKRKQMA